MSNQLKQDKIVFQPVRCTEKQLENTTSQNGCVYFTTDSQKIYLGTSNGLIPMSGSSGVFYANKNLTVENYAYPVNFTMSDFLEAKELPKLNDLIINVSPSGYNGFYRVSEVSSKSITGLYLSVGGGSGPAGPGGTISTGSLFINYDERTPLRKTVLAGEGYRLYFNIEAKDASGDLVPNAGKAVLKIEGTTYDTKFVYNNTDNYFDIQSEWLDSSISENTIYVTVTMDVGGEKEEVRSKIWYVSSVNLKLEWNPGYNSGEKYHNIDDTFYISFKAFGGIRCTACAKFDDLMIDGETYFEYDLSPSEASGSDIIKWPLQRNSMLTYGSHKCELWLKAIINGKEETTKPILGEITFIGDETRTFLSVPFYQTEATQYDTIRIPFLVYDPDVDSCLVRYLEDDNPVSEEISLNRDLQEWTYTLKKAGAVKLSIEVLNGDDRKDIYLNVKELQMEGVTEPTDYKFCLKANDFSTNEQLKSLPNITFENFDWEKGGLQTEVLSNGDVQKYICVRAGSKMIIDYKLFENFYSEYGKNFKICFKTTNCYDYAAPVLSCYDTSSKIGLRMTAQEAVLSTSSYPNFNTQYCEDSYIEFESEIWPDKPDENGFPGDRFLMLWADGIPVAAKPYAHEGETFVQTNAKPITIGSDQCDVYIYTIKIYERSLSSAQHLNNFILDAPSSSEIKNRYERNDILDNNGQISYTKLVQKNPNCHAYVYRIPRMTTSKDDKVPNCDYFELYGDYNTINNPYYKAVHTDDGVRIRVQGTSSAAYGVAAYNLRTEFQEGLIDKDGNKVDGWEVSDNAIPIDYVCTKVNVASCENANNVVNAEWYNNHQPYKDGHRRKTRADKKNYRDCMEFNSGVVFILDENKNDNYTGGLENYLKANVFSDTPNYVKNPYYKMYAIGNMGNDKKNSEVFHDIDNTKACCVEVCDNQNAEHHMTVTIKEEIFDQKDNPPYEFRYPDGNENATAEMKKAFVNFVNWMAESNPMAATNNDLPEPVDFKPYTFKGFIPPGYEYNEKYDGISLRGHTISTYATIGENGQQLEGRTPYTKDSYEYRMAKMLSECEDHLVMDSVVFHYLYIQRHTMVDNVAKNTFWSTEDGIHWDLTKNYDNDTSDGNDNSGYLTYSYGIEILDKKTGGTSIFNASNAVWLNFIYGLYSAQKNLYAQLVNPPEGKDYGAWDAQGYLKEFEKHQSPIPERCWIEDYTRKYIRPRRLGLDGEGSYLDRLEGGKKVHQRKQYETYQKFYMDSKYVSGSSFIEGSAIDMRLNEKPGEDVPPDEKWDKNYELPVTFYIDCYASGKIGGNNVYSNQRIKRGNTYSFPIGEILDTSTDGTCYIYGAEMIQSLKNIAPVYPSYVKLGGSRRIKELEIGSETSGYRNPNIYKIDVGANIMLQKLYAQNLGVDSISFDDEETEEEDVVTQEGLGSLSLANVAQLKELKLTGSKLSTLILPDGGPVELLHLNPLTTLKMSNLKKLNEIKFDEDIYKTLKNISVRNCPIMDDYTYELALKAPLDLGYSFNDFTWKISDGELNEHFELDENNKVIGIKVLDKLLSKIPLSGKYLTSLVGTLIIDINCNINEFDMYEKYCGNNEFYNLKIEYSEKVQGLEPGARLTFMANNTENASVHYFVISSGKTQSEGGKSIEELISADGPAETALTIPTKGSTDKFFYTFNGYWVCDGITYYQDKFISNPVAGAKNFNSIYPTESMVFIPQFNEETKAFEVKFHDIDGNVIQQNGLDSFFVPYGKTYKQAGGPQTNYYYLDSSNLSEEQRYAFQGWSENRYSIGVIQNPNYIDLDNYQIKKALNLYPHYIIESVYTTASDSRYFNYSNNVISLKEEYKGVLEGKITLPSKSPENMILNTVGNFRDLNNKITHIFFLPDSQYTTIGEKAFGEQSSDGVQRVWGGKLKIIDIPSTIVEIKDYAFFGMRNLESIGENYHNIKIIGSNSFNNCQKLLLKELPTSLTDLGQSAFYQCDNIQVTKLPKNLVLSSGDQNALGWCDQVRISEFGTENSGAKTGWIPYGIFYGSGTGVSSANVPEVTKVIIGPGITDVGSESFKNSYGEKVSTVVLSDNWNQIRMHPSITEVKYPETQEELLDFICLGINASTLSIMTMEEDSIIL